MCNKMTWRVSSRKGGYVLAEFSTETSARDYVKQRNANGVRSPWVVSVIAAKEIQP